VRAQDAGLWQGGGDDVNAVSRASPSSDVATGPTVCGVSTRLDPSWTVLASPSTVAVDRCVDVFSRPDGTFGFEEFRRDPEDMGAWTPVAYFSDREFATFEDAIEAARASVGWLAAVLDGDPQRRSASVPSADRLLSDRTRALRDAYEAAAQDYLSRLDDFLDRSEFDRRHLDRLLAHAVPGHPMLDLACGPGQCARYAQQRHVAAVGIDFAPAVLAAARARHGHLVCAAGDVRSLPLRDRAAGGAVALYVFQHVARAQLGALCDELHRVLSRGAPLLIGTHAGTGEYTIPGSDIPNTLYEAADLTAALEAAGITPLDVHRRGPIPGEIELERVYILATNSDA
jgi:SAM-dependent methyltransferase